MLSLHQQCKSVILLTVIGVLAQLGERMAGSHEVRGSIPLRSTIVDENEPFRVSLDALVVIVAYTVRF